jgi:PAS domain S-box-containing protein
VAHSIEVPSEIIRKWQEIVDLLAEIMHVPSASIMRVDPPHIKVFVSSTSKGNPCEPGALDTGPYCETVMKTGQPLLVPDALENEAWKANPHVKLGMISYLGVPIGWPDGRIFGTICVRDNKRNEYSEAYLKLLLHFRDMLQAELKSLARWHGEIEEREAKIRRLVDANIIGIFVWDFEGRVLEANEEFLRMVNYDREDLVSGRIRWADLTPPDWRDRNNARIEQQKSSGRFEPFEKEYTRKDGSRVPVLIGGATFEEGGNQGVAFVLDLTERNRAEGALRESEYKLRKIVETVPSLLWSTDPAGEPTQLSQRMVDYSGMQFEDFLHGGWEAFIHPDDFPETARAFYQAIRTGTSYQAVNRLRRADGEFRWHQTRGEPLRDREGKIVQWYGLSVDIDERNKAEERLRRSESYLAETQMELAHANRVATMGQLTASITHEVNQPITAAVTYALAARRFLSAEPPNFREVDDALSHILKAGKRAGEVVGRIRALIKKAPARKDAVEINDAILEVIALTRTEAANNSVSVRTQFAEGLPRVQGDRVQLQQVILNLIVNAIQSMSGVEDGNRELHISTVSIEPEGVCVAVRDTGHGLRPESLPRLFEPFYTTKPDGMGMGLSICRSIIEAHGGRLWATRCEPRGALFQFTVAAD